MRRRCLGAYRQSAAHPRDAGRSASWWPRPGTA